MPGAPMQDAQALTVKLTCVALFARPGFREDLRHAQSTV